MDGDQIICYDNVEGSFASATLCKVLTQTQHKGRVLGATKSATVPTNAAFLATGNNLTFAGDLSTRVLICQIDSGSERPEERKFKLDLKQHIREHRGELVKSALTILRAYHVTGRPRQKIAPYGRFEDWSNWVRSALVWLGEPDPCESRKKIEAADPTRIALTNVYRLWHAAFPSIMSPTAKSVIAKSKEPGQEPFLDALMEIAGNRLGNDIDPQKLGIWLKKHSFRPEGGFVLEQMGISMGIAQWRIRKLP
jgi:hypothetical protein